MNAWLRPGYYYVVGERIHREWKRALLVWGAIAIMLVYFVSSHLLPKYYQPQFEFTPNASASPAVSAPQPQNSVASAAPSAEYQAMQTAVQKWVNQQNKGEWSVVVQDLNNPVNHVGVNQEKVYFPASIYKLFLTIPMAQKVSFDGWKSQTLNLDQKQTSIHDCVGLMLSKSDNPCGEAIGKYVGWSKTDKIMRANGFNQTSFSTNNLKSSAADTARFLEKLHNKHWFDQTTREYIMSALAGQKYRAGIPSGCVNCTVLNKTGDLNGYLHDAAIVDNGVSKYVIVVFSKDGSYKQISSLSHLVNSHLTR